MRMASVKDPNEEAVDATATETDELKTLSSRSSETQEERSVTSRDATRMELEDQIAEFLAKGGKIDRVQPHVTADPPKKPGSSYGSRPI